MAREHPMFPLGSVLVPTMVMPLHVFEPRYRALARVCVDEEREFGVALIERGWEVGGGDVRTDIGCLARIVEHEEFDDGRWGLVAVGSRRVRVTEWLPDDPYPRALVEEWPDPEPDEEAHELTPTVELHLREIHALLRELGARTPPADMELSSDPATLGHQVAALAPAGPLDMYRLLTAPTPAARLHVALEVLDDIRLLIEAKRDDGPGDPAGGR